MAVRLLPVEAGLALSSTVGDVGLVLDSLSVVSNAVARPASNILNEVRPSLHSMSLGRAR